VVLLVVVVELANLAEVLAAAAAVLEVIVLACLENSLAVIWLLRLR
jgi:hypothetical protein